MGLLDLAPHKVSRDLRGYAITFYGDIKSGKTTTASKFPNALILAFEKGFSAIPGVYAQPINNWAEFLQILRELKLPEVKEKFATIVIDTGDIAYEYVEQYICNVESVDSIAKIPFGQGYTKAGKEFDGRLRQIVQLGYGLVIISHAQDKVFQNEDGTEYNKIIPTLPAKARLIVSRMCDIIGYSRIIATDSGDKTFLFMRGTTRFEAGSRFKYTPDKIEFTYNNLVNAITSAIDQQQSEDGGNFITDQRENVYAENYIEYDFDSLVAEFGAIVSALMEKDSNYYAPRVTHLVEKTLGKGKKVMDCTMDQAMLVNIIVTELKELK